MITSSLSEGTSDWSSLFLAALGTDVFDMEKPVIFTYEEIFSTTDGFSDSSLLGHGTYGSVYYGLLRDQVCSFLPGSYEFFFTYSFIYDFNF